MKRALYAALLLPCVLAGASARLPEKLPSIPFRPLVPNSGRVPASSQSAAPLQGSWVSVSDGVLQKLERDGKKPSWPGGTAGVTVDRRNGAVRIIVPDQGIWTSADKGSTFTRSEQSVVGGRCETGFALNADPTGGRLACFMLDGRSGITQDGGKTWAAFEPHGRGWDFGTVDWSRPEPKQILAVHHESDGELYHSADTGKSWKLLGKNYTAVGIFDPMTFVVSRGDGILRSADGGETWTKVSDRTPTGRTLCVFKGAGYWVTREGLSVSKDKGVTWSLQGSPIEAAWGPFFGSSEKQIAVVGRQGALSGFWRSDDAGQTWRLAAPFPSFTGEHGPDWTPSKQWAAGWFTNFGWDSRSDTYYASRMGHPTFKYERKR